jgi:hypothetical protein
MNEMGRLLQLAVATGPIQCENRSNFGKTILSGEPQLISTGHPHHKEAQVFFYIVHLLVS